MKKLLLCLIGGITLFSGGEASANVLIDKAKVALEVSPQEKIVDYINVHNTSDQEINVKVYLQDFVYVPPFDGRKKFFPPNSTELSCAEWLDFSPKEFSLPAFGRRKLNYTIKAPPEIKGGYYGVLFFETSKGKVNKGKVSFQVIQRIGCLFLLEAENRSREAKVEELSLADNKLTGSFLNSGNTILFPEGIFYVMDKEGLAVERGEVKKLYLPPKKKARFTASLPKGLKSGDYTLVLTFDLEKGDVLVKEIDFRKSRAGKIRVLEVRD